MSKEVIIPEEDILLYMQSPIAFAQSGHVRIHDARTKRWVTFKPWAIQLKLLDSIHNNTKVACLKSRQLGVTWVCLIYILWRCIFDPVAHCAIFSLSGREAKEAAKRLKGMYDRLPPQLRPYKVTKSDSVNGIWQLSNPDGSKEGSIVYSLPSTGGESLTLNTVLFDEAGRVKGYEDLLNRVMPAIQDSINSGTGRVMAVGIYDKKQRNKMFAQQIRDGQVGANGWKSLFFGWFTRPDRDVTWFRAIKKEMYEQNGYSDDARKQQYPTTIDEALSPPESGMRISLNLLKKIYKETMPTIKNGGYVGNCIVTKNSIINDNSVDTDYWMAVWNKEGYGDVAEFDTVIECPFPDKLIKPKFAIAEKAPKYPELTVYKLPESEKVYIATADPAQGTPTSDYSITMIAEKDTGVQVAILRGKMPPDIHAMRSYEVCLYYNGASILPERNNHGFAFIDAYQLMIGKSNQHEKMGMIEDESGKIGWYVTKQAKEIMYHTFVKFAGESDVPIVLDRDTRDELETIDATTLKCPPDQKGANTRENYDDLAVSIALIPCAMELDENKIGSATV